MKGFTQKEAIFFLGADALLITDEGSFGNGGRIYTVDVSRIDFTTAAPTYKKQSWKWARYNLFHNPQVEDKRIMKQEAAR
jgi:hypothetical protein